MNKAIAIFLLFSLFVLNGLAQNGGKTINIQNEAPKSSRFDLESLLADGMRFATMEEYDRADTVLRKALTLNPNIAAINYELAKVLVKRNQSDEAAIFAQKAFDLTPENKFYGLQLAEISIQQRKYNKAADIYKNIIKQSPDNIEYGFELASAYLLEDKYEEAIRAYNDIEKATGLNEGVIHQKQRIYLRLNKPQKAIDEATKLITSNPSEARYVVELAQLLLAMNNTDEAKKQLEKALEINPDEADAQVMLADIYKQKGDSNAANEKMGQMFKNPNADFDVKMQALAAMFQQSTDEAGRMEVLSRAQEIVKTHPKEVKARIVYADLLTRAGKKADARNEYVSASKIDKSLSEIWGAILQLDTDLNQIDSLIAHSEEALELFPNQGLFWYSNGMAYLVKRNYKKSVEALEEAQRLSSKNKGLNIAIQAQLGDAYNGLGQHEKSDEAYEAALKDDPKNDHVLNNYSYFLSLRKTKLDRAKEMAMQVVERNPDNSTYLDTYAWVLYVQKDYENARKYLEKAVGTGKASANVTEHYGDVLFKTGEKDKALEQWIKAKQMGANNPNLNKKIETKQLNEA